jgi:hypothetical protein
LKKRGELILEKIVTVFLIIGLFVLSAGCSDTKFNEINQDEVTFGTLKVHKDGTMVKDISLTENKELLKKIVELYNNSEFLSREQENIDPIFTDGQLEERISASYFTLQTNSSEDTFYIGYRGENIFKGIASGESFKKGPYAYYIENESLKEIIIENIED